MRKLRIDELNRMSVEEYRSAEKLSLVVVLDNVRSLYNVGAVFRSSDSFLVRKLYLCGITGKPPHREIQKTAIGATESVDWSYHNDVVSGIRVLKDEGYTIVGVEQTDRSIMMDDFPIRAGEQYALVLGNEVSGISDAVIPLLDAALEIPQFGTKHSLNISVAAGIVIHHFTRQMVGQPDMGASS